jgi:hypothetical protein
MESSITGPDLVKIAVLFIPLIIIIMSIKMLIQIGIICK